MFRMRQGGCVRTNLTREKLFSCDGSSDCENDFFDDFDCTTNESFQHESVGNENICYAREAVEYGERVAGRDVCNIVSHDCLYLNACCFDIDDWEV